MFQLGHMEMVAVFVLTFRNNKVYTQDEIPFANGPSGTEWFSFQVGFGHFVDSEWFHLQMDS